VTARVEIDAVSRRYREGEAEHIVLDGASASVAAGEFVALLGPSGSGKTTLLNLVAGIDLPDSGDVRLDGEAVNRLTERERTLLRRRSVGFVFQFFNLIPTLTVEENLRLPLELNGMRVDAGALRALLERVGLADRAHSFPDRLSGGVQQRVAVARALVHEPIVVLADEPTGNLDAATGESVLTLLGSLVRERGRTLLVATHSERVVAHADRTLELHDGRLVPA
jgi:putative ABC transport system ATP-binding protein